MHLLWLAIPDFRNYDRLELGLPTGMVVMHLPKSGPA